MNYNFFISKHCANFIVYTFAQKKQMEAIDEFIDSKIHTTYIIIDPLFKDCAFERDGWADKIRK